jgi:acyl transferase domain-containing protein
MIALADLNFLSPDSRCYSFDHRANGYSRGEGFGVVIIKTLSEALRNGDTIRAVIRATSASQDGRTLGITQPSSKAQEDMIRTAYRTADLDMATTRYFEAHGTGTPLGDPLEVSAINSAFDRPQKEPMYVGAVKSNIGHLGGASGVAGLIKTILVLEEGIIPPNIGFERVNPAIPLNKWGIKVRLV